MHITVHITLIVIYFSACISRYDKILRKIWFTKKKSRVRIRYF